MAHMYVAGWELKLMIPQRQTTEVDLSVDSLACLQALYWKFYNYYRDKSMILYYFPIAQNTVNKTVSDFFSSPEPKAPRWAISIPVTLASVVRPSVRQHFQTSSFLKPLGQLNSNFIWRLLRMGERKCVQMFLVTWPRWPPCPYMVKTL